MSTLSDLQKKLQQESEGIMFPFRTATVSTTQPVLDTATDGIMSITGQKYIGPDSVIQYSPEGQRQLKEIEKGMLPQFDQTQFPDIGKGKVEDRGGATPLPIDTTPLPQPEAPAIDPCPPGFKYDPVKKRCMPIEQPKRDDKKIGPTNPPRNIGPAASGVSSVADAIFKLRDEGGVFGNLVDGNITLEIDNSSILSNFGFLGKFIDDVFIKGPADKKFIDTFGRVGKDAKFSASELEGIFVRKGKDGKLKATFNQKGRQNFDNIATGESLKGNLASTQRKDDKGNIIIAPNGQPMIVGPIRVTPFGTTSGANFKDERIKPKKTFEFKVPKKGTGASGPPGTKSAPKKTGSSGKSGPPEGTRFSNLSRTKTTTTGSTGSASKKALSFRGF